MGGFEGGDEGGFWEEAEIFNPRPKRSDSKSINYTKLQEKKWRLHFVESEGARAFVLPNELKDMKEQIIQTLTRLADLLLKESQDSEIEEFLQEHSLLFEELAPTELQATRELTLEELFLEQLKESLNLILTPKEIEALIKEC